MAHIGAERPREPPRNRPGHAAIVGNLELDPGRAPTPRQHGVEQPDPIAFAVKSRIGASAGASRMGSGRRPNAVGAGLAPGHNDLRAIEFARAIESIPRGQKDSVRQGRQRGGVVTVGVGARPGDDPLDKYGVARNLWGRSGSRPIELEDRIVQRRWPKDPEIGANRDRDSQHKRGRGADDDPRSAPGQNGSGHIKQLYLGGLTLPEMSRSVSGKKVDMSANGMSPLSIQRPVI